jgi:3-hydroxyacyl-[acyl-carrier-protein] dehydratase
VGEASGFQERVVLAKVARAEFHEIARPGNTLTLRTNVEDIRSTGGIITGTCHIGDQLLAEVELVFANLDDRFDGVDQFIPEEFLSMLRILRMYEVGRKPDGSPLDIPPHLLEAEELAERQMNG